MGRDFTLFALKDGEVKYVKSGPRTVVSIVAAPAEAAPSASA
jgi:ribosomal protein L27